MRRDEVLAILAAHRDEARPDSEVDLLVEFDRPVGLYAFIGPQLFLEGMLGRGVDLGTFNSLRESIRATAEKDLVHVASILA